MYIWSFVKEKQLIRVRQALIQSLFTKDISWFDQHQRGEISSKLLSDIEILERGMGETIAMTIQWISAVVALLINSFVQSPDISKTYTQREENGKILVKKALIPAIDNIRLFAAFQSQEFEAKRLFKKFKFARHMTFRKYLCYGIKNGSFWMLAFLLLMDSNRVVPCPGRQNVTGRSHSGNSWSFDERHFCRTSLSLLGVYSSASELKVLNGFQLTVKQNQTVALVGPTGCGKSTVPQLILRFYDAKKGQVLISGTYIKEMKLQNLRRHIGFVSQKSSLLSGSVADNIRLGHESVTREQIVNAAKLANAHEFIMKLPQGYNTLINEDGNQLTDNEKLRISIARALVRNPKILLLDEVTSALDNASEKIVLKAIEKAQVGRTTIISNFLVYLKHQKNDLIVPRFSCSLMKRLLKLNFPDWSYAVIGSLASIAVGLIGPLMALFIAEFIRIFSLKNADDQYTARRDAAAQLMVVGAFLAPVNYLQNFCFAQTDSKLTMRMRDLLFKALLKQDMSYFDNPINNRDSLVNKFIHDAVDVNGATSLKLAMILQAVSSIISCIVICFVYSWQLAFPMLGIFLPTLIILNYIIGRLYFPEKIWKVNDLQEFLRKITQEAFANIKILAILVKEENFIRKCRDIVQFMYK
ncbi:ABCB1 [Acanthosepion pharaonis]|uniref:ABCB1 n=1 Tax=Acanthosepion pharaonis TaxID=158019 RepID=A0A812CDC0_ACAPH|nr:ABCB1 [Sepia pharaonis]